MFDKVSNLSEISPPIDATSKKKIISQKTTCLNDEILEKIRQISIKDVAFAIRLKENL